jgi:hypothetical protein
MPGLLLAQEPPTRRGLWIGLGFGGGQVEHRSDQDPPVRTTTVTASLRIGVVVVPAVRVGIEANGWLLEPSDFNDPTRGETVNETLFIAEVYPWPTRNLFLKAGYGWGEFHNKNPASHGSHAFGAVSLGIGYDVPVGRNLFVTMAADYSLGPGGSVLPPLSPVATGRRFRGWDVIVGIQYH